MALTDKQRSVLQGMAAGAIATVICLGAAIAFSPTLIAAGAPVGERLAFALQADTLIAVCLAIAVARLARHRFFTPEDIDGGGLTTGTHHAQVLQATLQNTLEQGLLAVLVHIIWATVMPISWLPAILVATILFLLGRILFIRGYASGAPSRALGFALTFYPSIFMLLLLVVALVAKIVA